MLSSRRPTAVTPRLRLRGRSVVTSTFSFAAVVAAAWMLSQSTRVLGWAAAAMLVAAILYPSVEGLSRSVKRGIAMLIVFLVTMFTVVGVIWVGVDDLRTGLSRLRTTAPDAAQRIEDGSSWVGQAARDFGLRDRTVGFLDDLPARLAGGGGSGTEAVRSAATRGIAVMITLVLSVFLVAHGPRLVRGLLRQIDESRRGELSTVLFRAYQVAWRYLIFMLAKALAVGLVGYVIGSSLDLPATSILAVIVGTASVIPAVGVATGGLLIVLLAWGLQGGPTGIVAAIAVISLQVLDCVAMDRFVQPRTLRIGPAASLFAILVGVSLYGFGGAAVGLALVVMILATLRENFPSVAELPAAAPRAPLP